jgi:hypothetical protein
MINEKIVIENPSKKLLDLIREMRDRKETERSNFNKNNK